MTKKLWKLMNRLLGRDDAVSAFLAMNIILWTLLAMIIGTVFSMIFNSIVQVNMADTLTGIFCAAVYVGIIMGLFGGILFLHRRS